MTYNRHDVSRGLMRYRSLSTSALYRGCWLLLLTPSLGNPHRHQQPGRSTRRHMCEWFSLFCCFCCCCCPGSLLVRLHQEGSLEGSRPSVGTPGLFGVAVTRWSEDCTYRASPHRQPQMKPKRQITSQPRKERRMPGKAYHIPKTMIQGSPPNHGRLLSNFIQI